MAESLNRSATSTPIANAYLMPANPVKNRRGRPEGQKPKIWKSTGQKPACLVNASVTYCGNDQIYAFGGFDMLTDEVYNHVLRLDLKTLNWALIDNYGEIPGVRMGHSATLYGEDKLVVYGGENEHREYLSDVVILDLKTHHWTQPDVLGVVPKGRARHAAAIYDDKLFIVGGLTGDIHIRSSRRETPNAPGAISSLKFISGPNVPLQSCGTHFHVCSSGSLLDFVTPASNMRVGECNLSALELDSLRWQRIVEGPEIFAPGYKWHYSTVNEDGTKVWLLGSPLEDAGNASQDPQLSEVLVIDLKRYGMLGNDLANSTYEQTRTLTSDRRSTSSSPSRNYVSPSLNLGSDLAAMFDVSPEANADSMADFIVTAAPDDNPDDACSESPSASPKAGYLANTNTASTQQFLSMDSPTSPPIHLHKMILHARWPHFRRLYASKMLEYQQSRLHIPEPYSVVRAFLFYLYTDSIAPSTFCRSLTDVAGMLVMANLYDIPKLRLLCVNRLSREIDIEHAAVIWERAGRTDEEWLKSRAARFCLMNWGRVVRTDGFRSLSRQSLMELCEVVDTEGRVRLGK
ncbi:hypothetical protein DV737_g5018, partial [Chaetothyriales sp. CBS 132003]